MDGPHPSYHGWEMWVSVFGAHELTITDFFFFSLWTGVVEVQEFLSCWKFEYVCEADV